MTLELNLDGPEVTSATADDFDDFECPEFEEVEPLIIDNEGWPIKPKSQGKGGAQRSTDDDSGAHIFRRLGGERVETSISAPST